MVPGFLIYVCAQGTFEFVVGLVFTKQVSQRASLGAEASVGLDESDIGIGIGVFVHL